MPESSEQRYVISLKDGYRAVQNCDINANQQFRSTACGFTILAYQAWESLCRLIGFFYVSAGYCTAGIGARIQFLSVVWLVGLPFEGSVKGLCIDFNKVDQLMGTDF